MRVLFMARVKRQIAKVPKHIAEKFWELVDELKNNPLPVKKYDIKKLRGYEHTYRVRIGDYRVIYEVRVARGEIIIHAILPRERAYK